MSESFSTKLYSMPNCGKCTAAKEKLEIFKIKYEEKPYKHYMTYHQGWRDDGSLDAITAKCFFGDTAVPLIECEGKFYDYPGFMKEVRHLKDAGKLPTCESTCANK